MRVLLDQVIHDMRNKGNVALLQAALERRYSANPAESFFTGGGLHTFNNFRREDNSKNLSVREGLRHSIGTISALHQSGDVCRESGLVAILLPGIVDIQRAGKNNALQFQ